MDLSHPQRITSSNRKRKAQDSMMVSCKRTKFMETYQRQNFSMPDSVIFYIAKNPKTAELYKKMVKTCKYFFVKNPNIVIDRLHIFRGIWRVTGTSFDLNLNKYNCKYWITDEIDASARGLVNQNILTSIIPKIFQCDAKSLYLYVQVVSFHDLSLIISSAEKIYLNNIIVKKCDSIIQLEDIVAIAINAKYIEIIKPTITSKTMKVLTKLPNFTKLDNCTLNNLTKVFDIDKNPRTQFFLTFDKQISDAFKNRLETIIDEIVMNGSSSSTCSTNCIRSTCWRNGMYFKLLLFLQMKQHKRNLRLRRITIHPTPALNQYYLRALP